MKRAYMMVGMPAVGKSVKVKELAFTFPGSFIYSVDALVEDEAKRRCLTYDAVWNDYHKTAKDEANSLFFKAIEKQRVIILDRTYLFAKNREEMLFPLTTSGYSVTCMLFSITDRNEWKRRLVNRPGKIIPGEVLESFENGFEPPQLEEGFSKIICFDMNGRVMGQCDHCGDFIMAVDDAEFPVYDAHQDKETDKWYCSVCWNAAESDKNGDGRFNPVIAAVSKSRGLNIVPKRKMEFEK